MSTSSNLCLSCRMCCNGTAVGFVKIENYEAEKITNILDVETENGKGFFLQPCTKLNSCGCEIYNERPKQCIDFQCNILRSLNQNKIRLIDALDLVRKAKRKKNTIESMIQNQQIELTSNSFYFKVWELRKKLNRQPNPSKELKTLIQEIEELNKIFCENSNSCF